MGKKITCPNHPERKATKLCMGCGTYFCTECITFVHNVAFCPNCQNVAEELRETYQGRAEDQPGSVYAEAAESEGPKYVATAEDARWEEGFDSSQLVQITRRRLSELERPLPLEEAQAGVVRRTLAHLIDLAIILTLAVGPFLLMENGTLQRVVALEGDQLFLACLIHGIAAPLYYRFILTIFGGVTLGRVATGIRLVNQSGAYLGIFQALVHTILEAVADLTGALLLLNGLVALLSKGRKSLIDRIVATQVVIDASWRKVARKRIYQEDAARLNR